jgi:hypothetical protein
VVERASLRGDALRDATPTPAPYPSTNDTVDWDLFDSDDYFSHNYKELRHDDAQIIEIVAKFFATCPAPVGRGRAIDVGTGTNLYPALAMLPFAADVTLFEHSRSNREWLREELIAPALSWRRFWEAMIADRPAYKRVAEPFRELRERTTVVRGNVFKLEATTYDVGTMFFVAESITTRTEEFEQATRWFVHSLMARAPFAAAFMRDSSGYEVGGRGFPACSIKEDDVRRCLATVAHDVTVQRVDSKDLRSGYDGMIVATGRAGRP